MDFVEPFLQPPRWARALLILALPRDPMRDAMIWRPWVSTAPVAAMPPAVMKSSAPKGAVTAFAGFVVVALVVLVMGVVVNRLLFSASQARGTHGSAAAGVGAVRCSSRAWAGA